MIRELGRTEATDFHGIDDLPDARGWVVIVHRPDQRITLEAWTREDRSVLLDFSYEDVNLFDPSYVEPGLIAYRRGSSNEGVWAVPFSLRDLAATGDPFLVAPGGSWASASRNGTTLATTLSGARPDQQLVWIGLDGSVGDPIGQPEEGIYNPALSPDGTSVVVRSFDGSDNDLWIYDIRRSTRTRLTFADGREDTPKWSPDGATVYFCHPTQADSTFLWRVPADGSAEPEQLTVGGFQSLTADGTWMVFERGDDEGDLDLWKWAVDGGSEPELLLATDAQEENASVSPDGRWVAYESNESGRREIYLKSFPSGSGKWQVSVDGGRRATWSPAADYLFFLDDNTLFRVKVEDSGSARLSRPERILDASDLRVELWRGFAVAPGSERILAVRSPEPEENDEQAPRGILVVQNWLSQFR